MGQNCCSNTANRTQSQKEPQEEEKELSIHIKYSREREELKFGSECEIYLGSLQKWEKGKIIKICQDEQGEWLTVRYNDDSLQNIQRYSKYLRAIPDDNKCDGIISNIVETLNLTIHHEPEPGYFRQTYKSKQIIQINNLSRSVSTAIYYMMTKDAFSILHRVKQDEVWHFYMGDAVDMLLIYPNDTHQIIRLGNDIFNGEQLQYIIAANTWQGTKIATNGCNGYALFGVTVAPGFEDEDFELGDRYLLIEKYANIEHLIRDYTKD